MRVKLRHKSNVSGNQPRGRGWRTSNTHAPISIAAGDRHDQPVRGSIVDYLSIFTFMRHVTKHELNYTAKGGYWMLDPRLSGVRRILGRMIPQPHRSTRVPTRDPLFVGWLRWHEIFEEKHNKNRWCTRQRCNPTRCLDSCQISLLGVPEGLTDGQIQSRHISSSGTFHLQGPRERVNSVRH